MIEVYTDGASSGNPGVSGAGVYIKLEDNAWEFTFPLPVMSNHEAEFHAVIKALDVCVENFTGEILSFRSDSKLVVDAIETGYARNAAFKPLLTAINERIEEFPLFFIKWISEKHNLHADQLARQAIAGG
ncbi:reverse transcriptase-like protein [Barrientosiimonas marina]|uniref:RNase H family protein n=1 Tax=Lentibacillus kimchii TaxID=1542911 RepID=A0ABW2UVW4_9BACI